MKVSRVLISKEVVEFTLLDVCLGMGLRVDGESIGLQSNCNQLFDKKSVDVKMVYHLLLEHSEELSLEDFCRLYILLGISKLLCPNHSGRVFPILFTIVEDFGSLEKYN